MLKYCLIVICASTFMMVFGAPGYGHIREKQSWLGDASGHSKTAVRKQRHTKDSIFQIEIIKGYELTGLQSKETFSISPLNDKYIEQPKLKNEINAISSPLDICNYNENDNKGNCVVGRNVSTLNVVSEDRTIRNGDYYENFNNFHDRKSFYEERQPPPPPDYGRPPPPHYNDWRPPPGPIYDDRGPPHHHGDPPPEQQRDPPYHYPEGQPPHPVHHGRLPSPPPSDFDYYNRRSSSRDYSVINQPRLDEDRQTRQSSQYDSYDNRRPPPPRDHGGPPPPPPHHGGPPPPPPHHEGPPLPPSHHGGPSPPPPHHGGPPPPPPHHGGPPPPPPHHGGPPPPPPHHGGPPPPPPHHRGPPPPPPPHERGPLPPPPHERGPPPPPPHERSPPSWDRNRVSLQRQQSNPSQLPLDQNRNLGQYDQPFRQSIAQPSYERPLPPSSNENEKQQYSDDNNSDKMTDPSSLFDDRSAGSTTDTKSNVNEYLLSMIFGNNAPSQISKNPKALEHSNEATTSLSPFLFQAVAVTPELDD